MIEVEGKTVNMETYHYKISSHQVEENNHTRNQQPYELTNLMGSPTLRILSALTSYLEHSAAFYQSLIRRDCYLWVLFLESSG